MESAPVSYCYQAGEGNSSILYRRTAQESSPGHREAKEHLSLELLQESLLSHMTNVLVDQCQCVYSGIDTCVCTKTLQHGIHFFIPASQFLLKDFVW